jgi:hypothetical protein
MHIFKNPLARKYLLIGLIVVVGVLLGACSGLYPQFTYQGVLTDASGNPYNGNVTIIYRLYNDDTGGTELYHETEHVTVTNGRFNSVVGPTSVVAGLTPEDLSQALWIELTVGNGTYTETLQPRQRLYGAPYAFTLMPGAVISDTFSTTAFPDIKAILNVNNMNTDAGAAQPALRVAGIKGIELSDLGTGNNGAGTIYSRQSGDYTDLVLWSNDEVEVHVGTGNLANGRFSVYNGDNLEVFYVNEDGDYYFRGNPVLMAQTQDGERQVYTMESPESWLEDFGSGALEKGVAQVTIDSLFASTVNLEGEYHVFLTPLGDSNGLYVTNKTATGFEVRESGGGTSNIAFDYRIVAHRAGYEDLRMEPAPQSAPVDGE